MHNRLEEYEDEENHLIDSILASPLDFGRFLTETDACGDLPLGDTQLTTC